VKLSKEQIEELVYDLEGTCQSMDNVIASITNDKVDFIGDLDNWQEVGDYVDDKIFLCRECGWWFETGYWNPDGFEPGNGEICLDCMPEENE
jgi:hypothetical protein